MKTLLTHAAVAQSVYHFMLAAKFSSNAAKIIPILSGLKDHPKDKAKRVKTLTVEEWRRKVAKEEESANPCAGCKFRKYHDWLEPTWNRFSAHYYDCENPSCPNWNRLWWRNNDDGSPLLDQEPIKLKRKIQHAAYALVTWMNDAISKISEEI